jgi:glycosyltransferase involved in cell wall biosynthesis
MQIVCHAFPAWEGNYLKSTVELMKQLAKRGHEVIYVDYAYTWKDVLWAILGKNQAPWKHILGLRPRLRKIPVAGSGCLYILSLPPMMPVNFIKNPRMFDFLCALQSGPIRRTIRSAMRRVGFDKPVYINAFNPVYGVQVVDKIDFSRRIYYCYDEISAAHWAARHGARLEARFVKHCDAVVVSSEGLQTKMQTLHPHVTVVNNGVDFAAFNRPVPAELLPAIPGLTPGRRVIGYVGSIDDRLDYDILERLFHTFSKDLFVFTGRIASEAIRTRLSQFSNVYLSGPKPATDLPGWVQQMDVCLIPFVKNKFTAAIYPLKINEYLAAGKPVVSTCFAALPEFEQVVFFSDAEYFESAVQSALDVEQNADYQFFAQKNDWSERAAQFEKICFN